MPEWNRVNVAPIATTGADIQLHTVLIAGAGGQIGRAVAQHLDECSRWEVIGLARRPRPMRRMRSLALDLANADECRAALARFGAITHLVYAARDAHSEGAAESVEANATMLRNVVQALESHASLEHVHVVHGTKYYGSHVGPIPVPVHEDSPRGPGENFYVAQEDFLREHSRVRAWKYTISRPHTFCDRSVDHPRSIGLVIAVYAAIQRELGLPLDFPGTAKTFGARVQFTDLGLLARAIEWMMTEACCANQAFNVVNGDYPRWSELWARFAQSFGIEMGAPRGFSLTEYMADKEGVWSRMAKKHGLRAVPLQDVALWAFGDYMFRPQWDIMSAMSKARRLGFAQSLDTSDMFLRQFDHYRSERLIPAS